MNNLEVEQSIAILERYSNLCETIDIRKDIETMKMLHQENETLLNIIEILENAYKTDAIAKEKEYLKAKAECPDLGAILKD